MSHLSSTRKGATDVFGILVVVSILLIASLAYIILTLPAPSTRGREILYLQNGDIARVDFVATLDTGEVFATSLASVGDNDKTYPKSLAFDPPLTYAPINVTMGAPMTGPGFEGLVDQGTGIQQALRGMAIGETRTVTLEPAEAFGVHDPVLVETRNLVESQPLKETVTLPEWNSRFLQVPTEDQTVLDPFWGWPVRVLEFDEGTQLITFRAEPQEGDLLTPFKTFQTRVEKVDAAANGGEGLVQVGHLLTSEDEGKVFAEGLQGGFLVVGVDEAGGTFLADRNDIRRDHAATYEITLLSISRP